MDKRRKPFYQNKNYSNFEEDFAGSQIENTTNTKRYSFVRNYVVDDVLTIKLFGEIPDPGNPKILEIVNELERGGYTLINVVLNSYGGSWDTGIMLYSMLKSLQKEVTVRTIGYASVFSSASIIYMAGQERIASYYTNFLIHTTRIATDYEVSTNYFNFLNNHLNSVETVVKDLFDQYLTHEELNQILKMGKDVYLNAYQANEKGIVTHLGHVNPIEYIILE